MSVQVSSVKELQVTSEPFKSKLKRFLVIAVRFKGIWLLGMFAGFPEDKIKSKLGLNSPFFYIIPKH